MFVFGKEYVGDGGAQRYADGGDGVGEAGLKV
jgi:hypothetical protein